MLMHKLLPDGEIHSIEHDWFWYLRWKLSIFGVHLHLMPLNDNYTSPDFPEKYFDFIFVDGRKRMKCMKTALKLLKDSGLLMLHDCNRERYQEGIKLYQVVKESDNTVLLKK